MLLRRVRVIGFESLELRGLGCETPLLFGLPEFFGPQLCSRALTVVGVAVVGHAPLISFNHEHGECPKHANPE